MSKLDKFKVALNKYRLGARAPFKDDFDNDSVAVPVEKQAMPRKPFKYTGTLAEALKAGFEEVCDWVQGPGSTSPYGDGTLTEELETMFGTRSWKNDAAPPEDTQVQMRKRYQAMLPRLYKKFAHLAKSQDLPYCLCGSLLEDYGIKVPTSCILSLDIDSMVDEYFGTCYQPSRLKSRFDEDFKEAVGTKLKQHFGQLDDFMFHDTAAAETSRQIIGPGDLVDLYGANAVKQWWRNIPEDRLASWRTRNEFLYDMFVEQYGGGLID
jgi:hypothetical protein